MNDIKKICNATNLKYLAVVLMFLDQIYQDEELKEIYATKQPYGEWLEK